MLLEIDSVDERPGREPGPVQDDELELARKRPLLDPGGSTVTDTSMNEDESLHTVSGVTLLRCPRR